MRSSPVLSVKENGGNSKLLNGLTTNGFQTLPSGKGNGHHPHHLQNGHSHTLRAAKNTLAAVAVKKCSTSSSGSGGTASLDSGSGSGGSGGSCGDPPSGSSCKSNSSSGSGAGPGATFSSAHSGHHQRSFSQATTVSFQHALLAHHLSSVSVPFGQTTNLSSNSTTSTLMDTAENDIVKNSVESVEPMSTSEAKDEAVDEQKADNSLTSDNSSNSVRAPIIDLLKEFDVCFNSTEHIDDDSSTLTDNSLVSGFYFSFDSPN